jgi:hypothetical protein
MGAPSTLSEAAFFLGSLGFSFLFGICFLGNKNMKKLNLKSYTVAAMLSIVFATLSPYDVQSRPPPPRVKELATYLIDKKINIRNVDFKIIVSDKNALREIMMALANVKNLTDNMYLYYSSDEISIEVTTNTPAGLEKSMPADYVVGQPIVMGSYSPDGIITANAAVLLACIEIVVVVVILGVAYYVVVNICKWIKTALSNSEWQATNIVSDSFLRQKEY